MERPVRVHQARAPITHREAHVCRSCLRSGWTFLGRLIHLSKKVRHLHHRVRISPAAKADIAWWQRCLSSHNGIAAFPAAWVSENTHHIYTDASDLAISGVWHNAWFLLSYSGKLCHLASEPIHYREMYAVVKALATWGPTLRGNRATLHIDNQAVCFAINKGASRCPELMALVRSYALLITEYQLECRAEYIASDLNIAADALSRLDLERFRTECPSADLHMTWPSPVWCDGVEI